MITKHLASKKCARHLPDELRGLMEQHVFPNGVIPTSFLLRDPFAMAVDVDKAMIAMGIHEVGGNNHGHIVGMLQSVLGGAYYLPGGNGLGKVEGDGLAWCEYSGQARICLIEDYLEAESPIPASASCMDTLTKIKTHAPALILPDCIAGCDAIAEHGTSYAGHWMGVQMPLPGNKMLTAEGNTGGGSDTDGDVFTQKVRSQVNTGDLYTRAFVAMYTPAQIVSLKAQVPSMKVNVGA